MADVGEAHCFMRNGFGWEWSPKHWFRYTPWFFAPGLLIAAILAAPLTWDGALYLLYMLDTGNPLIPQGRVANDYLHLPVVWTMQLTDSQPVIRFAFSLVHVLTPLISLSLCWWVAKNDQQHLMIWPVLTMGIALLPGQINFISEGIKANQMLWPLLLAIVIGAPWRTIPLITALGISIYFLHPVASPILAACGLAAIVFAILRRADAMRLIPISLLLLVAGIRKYLSISSGYEQSEMTWDTQRRQWENGATGWPAVALICCLIIAISILARPWIPLAWYRRVHKIQWVGIIISIVGLTIWAAQPSLWWEGLEYRGPAFWVTMAAAGCLFLNAVIDHFRGDQPRPEYSTHILAISIGFSIVIAMQSVAWSNVVRDFRSQLNASDFACIAREDLPGYPFTPLNLWSTNSLSLLDQGYEPDRISMSAAECHNAKQTGQHNAGGSRITHQPVRFDFSLLQTDLMNGTICTWNHSTGWYQQEALIPDSWRWTGDEGSIEIALPEAGSVLLAGSVESIQTPNTVDIVANGTTVQTLEINPGNPVDLDRLRIDLPAGSSTITFRSHNSPTLLPTDERPLAISVWNLVIYPGDGSSRCLQEDAL